MEPLLLMAWGPYGPYLCTVLSSRATHGAIACRRERSYSLWCVEDGAVVHEEDGKTRVVPAPCAVFTPPACRKRFTITDHSRWRALIFDPLYMRYKPGRRRASPKMTPMHVQVRPRVQRSAREIWGVDLPPIVPSELTPAALSTAQFCQSLWSRDCLGYARANQRLGQWLLSFVAWVSHRQSIEEHDWLARAEHAAQERLDTGRLTVVEMARVAGVSRQFLHRAFRRMRGRAPSEYLRDLWLERAKELLEQTDLSASRVALECGFRFANNFFREFKRLTGLTPLAWRRAHRR